MPTILVAAMRPWTVGGIAAIIVAMLVYDYTRPISTTAPEFVDNHRRRAGALPEGKSLGGYAVSSAFNIGPDDKP